jgi:hypothetical protein
MPAPFLPLFESHHNEVTTSSLCIDVTAVRDHGIDLSHTQEYIVNECTLAIVF